MHTDDPKELPYWIPGKPFHLVLMNNSNSFYRSWYLKLMALLDALAIINQTAGHARSFFLNSQELRTRAR